MRHPPERIAEIRPPPISPSLQNEFDSLLEKIDAVRKQFDDQGAARARALPRASAAGCEQSARSPARARRAAGLAILLTGAVALAGTLALAEGGVGRDFRSPTPLNFSFPPFFGFPGFGAPPPPPPPSQRKQSGARHATSVALCVRLCDGFVFPSAGAASDDGCAAQCPEAPTALYTSTPGSDQIDDAVSADDEAYSALPTAHRYRTSYDSACVCHRSSQGFTALSLNDSTLRRGDAVMTPSGLMVFQGAKSRSMSRSGFVPVSQAAGLAKAPRAALLALERSRLPRPPGGPGLANAPLLATSAASRPRH
jgi:hypothetical protein